MMTDREELIILSEHLQAVGRERDYWTKQAEQFEDELVLAREALASLHS